ncbi:hybrid sensor histidine kinase/response regulator [Haloplanus aerogenes]|uniref:histidine kinase n=1 Tax=Haloplanus aerogenes TaxID=660522 RepID=A0A3M0DR25_9EURY|nr:ATP-binding protein [Haloplanus aerogenes]AZH24448.1 PAS domain S-box protein [Haloplanus aerogenes]RMB23905.1 PAS domain S-box-containing protein [Haloplanus aerogenes]
MTDDISVLLVDDETVTTPIRESIRHHHDDIVVRLADGADDALSRLETDDIDCVVCEYGLEASGRDLLDAIRERWPTLPVVLFTDRGSEAIASDAITDGATDYLRKRRETPQHRELTDCIRTVVARCRAEAGAQRASHRDDTQFELLVDAVENYAIFLLDETGHVRTWNPGAETIKGYTRDEIIGEHVSIFYTDADVDAGVPERNLREAAAGGRVRDEGWRVHKDGSMFRADVTIVALYDDGDVTGYAKITRDETPRHREQILLEQNQQLKEHIAGLAHDLRNPLTVARGNVEMALETGDYSGLDASKRGLDRMEELLDSIVSLAQEDDETVEPEPIDLRDVAEEAWSVVPTGSATLRIEENAMIVADRGKLQQLFENLFKNAVDHGGPTPTVRVGRFDGGFYVEDDGPGIPTTERTSIFEMGHSTDPDGTGVGLAICERIAEAHGWDIGVETAFAGGARFEVSGTATA